MEGESVFENTTRRMIYNHIYAHPGVTFLILKKVLNLNESTLRYHLNYLERSEKISFGLEKGKRYYYPHSSAKQIVQKKEGISLTNELELTNIQARIIDTIQKYPKLNQKELSKRTRVNRITLNRNLKILMDLCLVRKIPNGNMVLYEYMPNEQLRYEILKKLLKKLVRNEIDEETFLELKRKLD
jgi:predicted transcriptional regulator